MIIQEKLYKFFKTNGFAYIILTSIVLILIAAGIYSFAEHSTYANSVWWAITTVTTVGYGDVSPSTRIGRIIAVILMILGIGLIGSITSTVTTFYMKDNDDKNTENIETELNNLKNEIKELQQIIKNK